MAGFKSCWAADSLNGLKRLTRCGRAPEVDGPGGSTVDAGGREAGYSQLARVPYASMAPASAPDLQMCLQSRITAVLKKTARNPATRAGEADFLKRSLKRGTPRACNLLNGKLSPQTSSFLKR